MQAFSNGGGQIMACRTCLKLRTPRVLRCADFDAERSLPVAGGVRQGPFVLSECAWKGAWRSPATELIDLDGDMRQLIVNLQPLAEVIRQYIVLGSET